MNAKEFIKQYGWDRAKRELQYKNTIMAICNSNDVWFEELKQLVDAWELVESYGGYDLAKNVKDITPLRKASYDLIENLKEAIELVESVNG